MIELVVSTAILAMLLGFASLLGGTGRDAYLATSRKTGLEVKARRALDRVAAELALARRDSLLPPIDPIFGSSSVEFQRSIDIDIVDGEIVWNGPITRIAMECDGAPGDPCRLLLTRDVGEPGERTFVLSNDVSALLEGEQADGTDSNGNGLVDEPGFCLSLEEDVLTIRLTAVAGNGAERRLRTLETALRLRN